LGFTPGPKGEIANAEQVGFSALGKAKSRHG
jgi:hypothetical protein